MNVKTGRDPALGTAPVGKLFWKLALPAIAAQLVNVLYNIVDRIYIGHIPVYGAAALTGVGVTMPAIMIISAFAALVSAGGAPRVSMLMGKGAPDSAERIIGTCTFTLCAISLALTLIMQLFAVPILRLFGASDATLPYALEYISIYSLGTIFVQLSLGLNAFITAQGFSTTSMLTVTIGAALNIVLDPLFMFVFGMGVRGAALATILSQAVSCAWVVRFLCSEKSTLRLRMKNLLPDMKLLLPCLALGLSPFLMQITENLVAVSFNVTLLRFAGDTAVGAVTVLTTTMSLCMQLLHGLTQGAQPIMSFNYGERTARARNVPHPVHKLSHRLHARVGGVHALPRRRRRNVHAGRGAFLLHRMGHAHLHGRERHFRHPDRVPAELCCARAGKGGDLPRAAAQGDPAHPAHSDPAAARHF